MFARGIQPPALKSAVKCETSLEYWWCIGSCGDRQSDHCYGFVDKTIDVEDDDADDDGGGGGVDDRNISRSKSLAR